MVPTSQSLRIPFPSPSVPFRGNATTIVIRPRWIRPMQSILGGACFPAQCADAATGWLAGILNRTENCFLKNVKLLAQRAGLPGKEERCLLRPLSPPTRQGLRFALPVMMETLALSALIFCSTDGSSFTFCPPFTTGRQPSGFMGPMKTSLSVICGGKVRFGRKYFYSSFIS